MVDSLRSQFTAGSWSALRGWAVEARMPRSGQCAPARVTHDLGHLASGVTHRVSGVSAENLWIESCRHRRSACHGVGPRGRDAGLRPRSQLDRRAHLSFPRMRSTDGDSSQRSASASTLQVGTPASVLGNVAMPAFCQFARVENGLYAPAVRERRLAPVEVGRLACLNV